LTSLTALIINIAFPLPIFLTVSPPLRMDISAAAARQVWFQCFIPLLSVPSSEMPPSISGYQS
jgi:hypothetical protein